MKLGVQVIIEPLTNLADDEQCWSKIC